MKKVLLLFVMGLSCSKDNPSPEVEIVHVHQLLPLGTPVMAEATCPTNMILVEGNYCPKVIHHCKKWMDKPGSSYSFFRCAEYTNVECKSEKKYLKFCIDKFEYTKSGEKLPEVNHSWTSANLLCQSLDKRLCMESEWQFACEGEEILPYPYGWKRDNTACNIDQPKLGKRNGGLFDLREPTGSRPKCVSPFGVYDMSGNVEEWATLDVPNPHDRSTMKGAWWLPGRNHCRAATTKHGETYFGKQVGVRCCKNYN